jgi:hypothetical protein
MTPNFQQLTEEDTCPKCDYAVQVVVEMDGRGTSIRQSDIYDVHKDPTTRAGIDRYYFHFNQRP